MPIPRPKSVSVVRDGFITATVAQAKFSMLIPGIFAAIALDARRLDVLVMVVRQVLMITAIGIVIGGAADLLADWWSRAAAWFARETDAIPERPNGSTASRRITRPRSGGDALSRPSRFDRRRL
ncbi:MAG TPA: hypothetical protein VHE78_16865 [Gemmatimonadaceae bacterium]|nr:hypothetical protein [Gemmatimonadaceae bacterium]